MKEYFLKDKKIEIYRNTIVDDGMGGGSHVCLQIGAARWAYMRQLSQKEILAAGVYGASETVLFIVNYNIDILTGDIIKYKNLWYDITRIDTFEGYKNDLTIYVKSRTEAPTF